MSKLTSKQIIEFAENVSSFRKREEMKVHIHRDGVVNCLTWGPLINLHDASFDLRKNGYQLNPADIPRAAAVLRLQGYEVTIEEG